jgi:Fe-S cluster biosynthesis and repair protein YggX
MQLSFILSFARARPYDAEIQSAASSRANLLSTVPTGISIPLRVSSNRIGTLGALMANDSCGPTPAPSEPPKPGTRMVQCVKFGREMPGLDRVPWKGELGKRVYESVSKDAWKLWIEHSKMVMNEYRLNPLDPNSQKIMEEQMELFFFGAGSALPEGYVAPKGKG